MAKKTPVFLQVYFEYVTDLKNKFKYLNAVAKFVIKQDEIYNAHIANLSIVNVSSIVHESYLLINQEINQNLIFLFLRRLPGACVSLCQSFC